MSIVSKDYSYGSRSKEDVKRALPSFVMIIIATIGVFWLSANGVEAGTTYLFLLVFGVIVLFLSALFTKSSQESYEIPITTSVHSFSLLFILGALIPFLLYGIPQLIGRQSFITAKYVVPLAFGGSAGGVGAQSFAVLSITADQFWKSFIIVFTAGTIEPFAVGFAAVAAGVLIGYAFRQLTTIDFGEKGNKWFDFAVAMVFSISFFVIIHTLNDSYTLIGMFVAAGLFRFFMNMGVYVFNFFLAFLFGFHQANNFISLGIGNAFAGFLSHPLGWVVLGFYALIVFNFFINIKKLPDTIKDIWENIGL